MRARAWKAATAGLVLAIAAVGVDAATLDASVAAAPVPTVAGPTVSGPTVSGPVTGGGGLFDLQADVSQLPDYDYVQDEFFLEGTARAFNSTAPLTADGKWTVAPVSTAAYKTRMVVRRPRTKARSNGVVLVEWYNVTAGFDNGPDWSFSRAALLREGITWVGVSAQYVGVEGGTGSLGFGGLKATDPERYGSLVHPGDIYSYDIYTQAARALRSPNGVDPMGGLRPQWVDRRRRVAVGVAHDHLR